MEHQTTYLGDGFTRHADGVIRFDEAPDHVPELYVFARAERSGPSDEPAHQSITRRVYNGQ